MMSPALSQIGGDLGTLHCVGFEAHLVR